MALHCFQPSFHSFQNPNPNFPFISRQIQIPAVRCSIDGPDPNSQRQQQRRRRVHPILVPLVASAAVFLVGVRARACHVIPPPVPTTSENSATESNSLAGEQEDSNRDGEKTDSNLNGERMDNEEFRAAFESWKSKTYALTVPLRIVSLRGSVPPSWIKDFMQVQGKRVKLISELRGSLESIFSDLSSTSDKNSVEPKSAMAADLVTVGDSWLSLAISKGLIEPMKNVEEQDWFKGLSTKWKVYLCRNNRGELDSNGYIWGAPYRWGTMVIAYKKSKFRQHKLAPIEDWRDLWRPELAGKISMVDAPREVIGAVLKHMGASYNIEDIDSQVVGGRQAVLHNLAMLQRQVRLFDNVHYLKAFSVGDVWVAVGWSNDVIPAAKRMSNVAVVAPKSGTSLWADLWAVPAATRFTNDNIGGRIRGPSPLIHQWIEFCLQTSRMSAFKQQVTPGASPHVLERLPVELEPINSESTKGKPKLETNLIDGVPPPEILSHCEFLEPLSEKATEDYQWLISSMQKPDRTWIRNTLSNSFKFLTNTSKMHEQRH